MFNGKRQKALEEQLAIAQKENESQKKTIKEIVESKDAIAERFARLTASRVSFDKNIEQMQEEAACVLELAEESKKAANDVHSTVTGMNNAVESFGASHTVFLGQMKKHNENLSGLLEQQRGLLPPVQAIEKEKEELKGCDTAILSAAEEMKEYAKTMGVLALNAAIEAGRLGDAGLTFINAAEEVRSFSEKYDTSVRVIIEQQKAAAEHITALEEQVVKLQALLKENTVAAGKIYSGSMQTVATYEAGQIDLRETISLHTVGKTDALTQAGDELIRLQEELKTQLTAAEAESREQRDCAYELEAICNGLQQKAENA